MQHTASFSAIIFCTYTGGAHNYIQKEEKQKTATQNEN